MCGKIRINCQVGLNSMVGERVYIVVQTKIDAMVSQLRKAPSSIAGISIYKMMFGRDIRTKLNIMPDKRELNGRIIKNG